jgi:hypothetical protein
MGAIQSGTMLLIGFALLRGAAVSGFSLVSQQVVNLASCGVAGLPLRLPVSDSRPAP